MPIKLPKAFPRRKSSGNALEELTNPPEPSFRVFERPDRKSFDGGNTLKRMSQGRPLSAGHNLSNSPYTDESNPNFSNRYLTSEKPSLASLTLVSGSGGTNNSSSSGGHDNSSSSARFSSSSTLPSPTDIPLDDKPLPHPHDTHRLPPPPVPATHPLSLRAGGRAFSFGRKKPQSPSSGSPITQPPQVYGRSEDSGIRGRDRALTESSYASGSTAMPPKLLDTGLDLGSSDFDSFGDMFENFGKRRSTVGVDAAGLGVMTKPESPGSLSTGGNVGTVMAHTNPESISPAPVPRTLTTPYFSERSSFTPSPIQGDRSRDVREAQSSPYSWTSHGSHDGLMDLPGLASTDHAPSYEDNPSSPWHAGGPISTRSMPTPAPNSPSNRKQQQRQSSYGAGLRRTSAYASRRDSIPFQDEDAKLVIDSIYASRRLNRHAGESEEQSHYRDDERDPESTQPSESLLGAPRHISSSPRNLSPERRQNYEHRPHVPIGLFDTNEGNTSESDLRFGSNETTPRAKTLELANRDKRSSLFDASLHPPPRAGLSPAAGDQGAKAGLPNKVMTPAQFERYRKEQEMARTQSNQSKADDSDDDSDHYDDDDAAERTQELAKQRRKQEAHLAVYRQQMMKVTGEQPSQSPDLGPLRPPTERASASAPNVARPGPTPTFTINKASMNGKASDDEDDEIPLGVLAAHGFPNKNRPPGTSVNGSIRYTSESYPPPQMSTSGMSAAGGPRGLPAFAKNLPPDPYYGAGLVNQTNREMPSFGNHGSGSQYGGASPNLHPGGLVGVIAGEERAKAMRRGSPNAQGNYGSPLPPGMAQMTPGLPPMMSPGDEAQIQMSHQMTQMMQMQMQWMQSMQQMMGAGMQPPQPGQMPPGMPPMPPPHGQLPMHNDFLSAQGHMVRPMSHSAPSTPSMVQQQQQRAMSMMSHNLSPQWPPRNTASPSMMGGAFGPQGYSPSIAPSERSNIGQPSRYRPVSVAPIDEHSRPVSRSSNNLLGPGINDRKSPLTVSSGGKTSPVPPKKVPSDDDDDEGWEEMKKKREQKASTWRMKKRDGNSLKELYYPST
ncbi:MAG: hypothetical protein LQ343_007072 [Gyalolechia ehrenbergii]|nr:MAG: hypothetical protein LQ343_007072 [Gyalolechia ehrenbergii]